MLGQCFAMVSLNKTVELTLTFSKPETVELASERP